MRKNEQRLSVVHINTHDAAGGAAKVAWRLAEAQRHAGHDSRMLVGYKKSDSEHSFLFPAEAGPSIRAQCRHEGQLFYEFQGSHKLINNPLVRSADILHLHNLHGGYFNPFSLSALSHFRPVVWTLHDMQSITGHCAHSFDCQKWQSGCYQCPHLDIEPAIQIGTSLQLLSDKKLIYDHSYLWLVTPSQWLKSKVEKSILQDHPVELIYNGVDTTVFKPCDKKEARKKFGIAENVLVIGAVAHGGALTNQWKGGKYTQAALDALASKFPEYVFVNIGGNFETDKPRIVNIPHVGNESELAQAYSTLDIFLNTSIADNCPLVILEALSCGIAIVSFATGGIPELVCDGEQGCITACGDQQQLVRALYQLAVNPQLQARYGQSARERAVSRFDFKMVSEQYENLYRNILEESKTRINNVKLFPSSKVPKIIMSRAFIESENSKSNTITPKAKPATPDVDSSQTEYDVSIVLCTKDRASLLDQMLESLSDAIQNTSCEVIVIDGGSSDNTLEVLKRHGVTKIYNEAECLGPGRHSWPQLYNLGFSKARGKWAMYASDDIIFGEGCITEAVKSLNQQTDEVAGGIFFYKNLYEKPSVEKFYTGKYFVGFSCGQKLIMNYGLLRMDYFREVGGLDERYRFYCADGDLCLKLYESGKQLVPLPQCFLIHNNVLDMQKKSSEEGLKDDDSLYRQRWRHFVSTDDPNPRRLLWQPDFVEAFALPAALRPVDSGIEYFWHGIACLQRGMFKMALEKFAQTMRTSCRHWVVLWYSAKAAYGCGNFEVAKKAAQMVVKHVPEFNQAQQFLAGLDAVSSTLQIKNTSADLPKFGLGAEVESKPRKIYCVLFDTMPLLDEVVSLAKENAMELLRQVGGCFTTTSCIEMLTGKLCSDLEKNGMGYERHNRYRDLVTNDIYWPWEKELIVNRLLEHGWQINLHNSVYFSTVLSSNPAFEKTTSLPGGLQAEKEFWNDKKAIVETILGDGPQSEQFYQDEIRHIHQIQSEKPAKDKFYFVKYDQFHVANVEKSDKNVAARRVIELMKQWDFNEPNAMFWFFSDHGDWRMMGEHPQPDHYLAWVMFRDNTADAVEVKSRFIFAGDFFATIMNKFGYGYESVSDARSVQQPQDTDRIYYTEDGRQRFDVNDSTTAIACRFTGWDRGRPSGLVQVSYFKPRNEFVCLLAHLNADGFVTNTLRIDKIDECLKQALIDRFEWVDGELTLVKGSVGQQLYSPQERFLVSQTGLDTSTRRIDNVSHMEDIRNVAGQVQAIESKTNTLSQLEAAGLWRQGQPLRLHLGCGNQRLDGYINIDYPPDKHTVVAQLGADFYADITKLSFPAQSVDEIRLHHVFEHFNRGAALGLLAQWQQWLKIGAKLHIETPDALGCARMLASNISYKIKQGILRHMFGSHEADWAYHYDGWYDEKFQKTLSSLEFEVTCHTSKWQHEPYLANVKAVAIKRRNLSREQLLVVCDRLLLDSMVADVPAERRMHEIWCQEIRNFQNDGVPVQAAQEQHHLPSSGKQCSMMFTAGKDLSDFNSSCSEKALS